MRRISKYSLIGLAFGLLLFLGWEWWHSYPKVRLVPVSFPESKEAKIDSILIQSVTEYLIPGMAVGIIQEGKVSYLKAFGYENLQTKDSMRLESLVPVASVSKLFTALTLANFALEKEISINSSINSLLAPDQKLPSEFDQISLAELLTHTSGLEDRHSISQLIHRKESRKLENLPDHLQAPTGTGAEYEYADVNFDLIGFLLERAAERPFEELAKARTLQVAGMDTSSFVSDWPLDTLAIRGYQGTFLWKRIEERNLNLERFPSPSAGLLLSPLDLSHALLHLCREDMGIFGEELAWLKNDKITPAGFQEITINASKFQGHYGGQGGYSSLVFYSPELEVGFFLVSNARDKVDFRKAIAESVLKILIP